MNKLDTKSQNPSFALAPVSTPEPIAAQRFVVLIPAEADYSSTSAHRIWELANAAGASVQFLGLCRDEAEEPSLRRELITLSALVQDGRIDTAIRVKIGSNWIQAVKSDYQPGDMVVCFAEQRAGLLHKPLSQILQASLDVPIYILSGLVPQPSSTSNWLSSILGWSGSLGIIAGFFGLQVKVAQMSQDWSSTVLMCLTLLVEVGLVLGWNSLFS